MTDSPERLSAPEYLDTRTGRREKTSVWSGCTEEDASRVRTGITCLRRGIPGDVRRYCGSNPESPVKYSWIPGFVRFRRKIQHVGENPGYSGYNHGPGMGQGQHHTAGNPQNVTLFGQSGGGREITILATDVLRDYFTKL